MRSSLAFVVLAVLAGGCVGRRPMQVEAWREVPGPDGAEEAIGAATGAMGITGKPEVHWYGGAGLDADCGGVAWHPYDDRSICVGEEELDGVIAIVYIDGKRPAETWLAHGLGHMWSEEHHGGDGDFAHDRIDEIWGAHGVVEVGAEAMGAIGAH